MKGQDRNCWVPEDRSCCCFPASPTPNSCENSQGREDLCLPYPRATWWDPQVSLCLASHGAEEMSVWGLQGSVGRGRGPGRAMGSCCCDAMTMVGVAEAEMALE